VLLKARGQWDEVTDRYVRERMHPPLKVRA
jgi:hypothetical protein